MFVEVSPVAVEAPSVNGTATTNSAASTPAPTPTVTPAASAGRPRVPPGGFSSGLWWTNCYSLLPISLYVFMIIKFSSILFYWFWLTVQVIFLLYCNYNKYCTAFKYLKNLYKTYAQCMYLLCVLPRKTVINNILAIIVLISVISINNLL